MYISNSDLRKHNMTKMSFPESIAKKNGLRCFDIPDY